MRKKAKEVERNRRLQAVKLRSVLFDTKCQCCGDLISREKMYVVQRWGKDKAVENWYYCRECMHSKEDVLDEIYKDGGRGIAYVDEYSNVPRKYSY